MSDLAADPVDSGRDFSVQHQSQTDSRVDEIDRKIPVFFGGNQTQLGAGDGGGVVLRKNRPGKPLSHFVQQVESVPPVKEGGLIIMPVEEFKGPGAITPTPMIRLFAGR